jgi:hypothetical protein
VHLIRSAHRAESALLAIEAYRLAGQMALGAVAARLEGARERARCEQVRKQSVSWMRRCAS